MLKIEEILSELEYNKGSFPHEAVQEAIKHKNEIIPELLKVLENTGKNIDQIKEKPDYLAHIYSMFLLAQFSEKRAYPLIVDIFSHSGDTSDSIAGDFITEDLQRVLASVCHGDTTLIKQLIENREIDEYVRDAGLSALLILVVNGKKTREEIMDYYKSLFRGKLEKEYSFVWTGLVLCSSHLCPRECYEDIKMVYKEDLVDPIFMDLDDVNRYLSRGWELNLNYLKEDVHYQFIDDTIKSMEWWVCFHPKKKKAVKPLPKPLSKPMPKKSKREKIGRNQPCPCGSGKKYKKCCGSIQNR
ncbi:MAG: DUF1186 domain-containing protein [Thermoplasmata archaeon]|nr:MAG: DUF1186 domain-containing protein [Thermoplasmata archaeon]